MKTIFQAALNYHPPNSPTSWISWWHQPASCTTGNSMCNLREQPWEVQFPQSDDYPWDAQSLYQTNTYDLFFIYIKISSQLPYVNAGLQEYSKNEKE